MDGPISGQLDGVLDRAQAAGGQARLRALGDKREPHSREDLARTAREFESVFLDIMMQAMRRTVPDNDLMGSGGATRLYRQMHDSEIARSLANTGEGLGIAKLLEAQFASQVAGQDPSAATVRPTGGPSPELALSRYRQHGARDGEGPATSARTLDELNPLPPAPRPQPPAVETAPPAGAGRPLGPPVPAGLAVDVSRPSTTPDAPPRLGLVPSDRRLSEAPLAAAEADTVRRFGPAIDRAASAAGLDPRLVLAVVMEESGGDPGAHSPAGAHGLMQLMPGTAQDLGVSDRADPDANLAGGARYLSAQLKRFDGRVDLALAAYNAGPGHVQKAGGRIPQFTETRNYVQRVMARWDRLRAGTELDKAPE